MKYRYAIALAFTLTTLQPGESRADDDYTQALEAGDAKPGDGELPILSRETHHVVALRVSAIQDNASEVPVNRIQSLIAAEPRARLLTVANDPTPETNVFVIQVAYPNNSADKAGNLEKWRSAVDAGLNENGYGADWAMDTDAERTTVVPMIVKARTHVIGVATDTFGMEVPIDEFNQDLDSDTILKKYGDLKDNPDANNGDFLFNSPVKIADLKRATRTERVVRNLQSLLTFRGTAKDTKLHEVPVDSNKRGQKPSAMNMLKAKLKMRTRGRK